LSLSARQVSNRSSQYHQAAFDATHHRFAIWHRSADYSPAHQLNAVGIENILALSFNRHRSTQPPTTKVGKEHGSPNIQSVRLYPIGLSSRRIPKHSQTIDSTPVGIFYSTGLGQPYNTGCWPSLSVFRFLDARSCHAGAAIEGFLHS